MHAQFQRRRQAVFLNRKRDDREVFVEFLLKLFHVADVVHAFFETAGEFRRHLRAVGFVHGNFRCEIRRALRGSNVLANFSGVLHCEQKLVRHALNFDAGNLERPVNVRNGNLAGQFRMAVSKGFHVGRGGRFADAVGDVNRKKIRRRDEAVYRLEPDVVGVHVIRFFPAERRDRGIGFRAQRGWFGANEAVFAVRFVPDRDEFRTELSGLDARRQLRLGLMTKAVAYAEGEFSERKIVLPETDSMDYLRIGQGEFVDTGWHADHFRVVRMCDGQSPQLAQRFTPASFLLFVQKQCPLADQIFVVYEAGPGDFHLHRQLTALGVMTFVVHPVKLDPQHKGVVTDKTDAFGETGQQLLSWIRDCAGWKSCPASFRRKSFAAGFSISSGSCISWFTK
jgi:hypothetical protein